MSISQLSFLVAEDHSFQRNTLVRVLEGLGATTVYEAEDGHGALKVLQDPARKVDIVISDLEMPGMDGMEFLRHLGEAGIAVSIILASALERKLLASIATMSEAYGIRLLGVVEKPLTPAKLSPLIALHKPAEAKMQAKAPRPAGRVFTLEEIADGLQKDQFEPFFQPKIELSTGLVKGAEALARWRHPLEGVVAPYAFIKPLEDNGLIDHLTWTMLKRSAALCASWRRAGLDFTVSVNVSVKSLADLTIADRVTELVRGQDLDPRHMVLEITESAATTELGSALENLARLRIRGFGLSIDDYGTGYSSMQQLMRIAFTELKVDQSFVVNAAKENSASVVLESSLEMAKKLNIASVAEGVETRADFDLLCRLRCDMAQGYFIAKPMDSAAYLDWTRSWKPPDGSCSSASP